MLNINKSIKDKFDSLNSIIIDDTGFNFKTKVLDNEQPDSLNLHFKITIKNDNLRSPETDWGLVVLFLDIFTDSFHRNNLNAGFFNNFLSKNMEVSNLVEYDPSEIEENGEEEVVVRYH